MIRRFTIESISYGYYEWDSNTLQMVFVNTEDSKGFYAGAVRRVSHKSPLDIDMYVAIPGWKETPTYPAEMSVSEGL